MVEAIGVPNIVKNTGYNGDCSEALIRSRYGTNNHSPMKYPASHPMNYKTVNDYQMGLIGEGFGRELVNQFFWLNFRKL